MEQTITCPNCRKSFRIAKDIFEKYKTGVSLKKHELTDGDAILLDCAGCGRTLKISITTWNVVGEGPAQHMRGYEWVGGDRPRLVGENEAPGGAEDSSPSLPERPGQSASRIHLTEFGRVEKPLPEVGLGVLLAVFFLCFLPVAVIFSEQGIIALADDAGYVVPSAPEKRSPELPAVAAPVPEPPKEQAPEADEPRLLTPVKEPTFLKGGNLEKMLRKYNKQVDDVEKQGAPAK